MHDFLLPPVKHGIRSWGILFCGLGLAGEATAQQRPPRLQLGVKFGINLSTFVGARAHCADAPYGWEAGAAAGLVAIRPLSAHSAVQLELLGSQKGIRQRHFQHAYQDPSLSGNANTYHAQLQYLDVPLLYTWGPGRPDQTGPFVALGPQVSVTLTKREYVHPTSESPGGPHEETLDTNYHSLAPVTAGYVVGAGYRWATGKAAGVSVELRYSGDLTRVYAAGYGAGTLCPRGSNQFSNGVVQVQVSCLFGHHEPAAPAPAPPPAPSPPPVWPPRPVNIPLPRPVPPPAPRPAPRRSEPQLPGPRRDRPAVPDPTHAPTLVPSATP